VRAIASGVLKEIPLAPGTCVTLMANTRVEWILCDWAMLSLGLRTVPIYVSLLAPEVGYIHADTGAELLVVENKEMLEKVRAARQGFTFYDKEYPGSAVKLKQSSSSTRPGWRRRTTGRASSRSSRAGGRRWPRRSRARPSVGGDQAHGCRHVHVHLGDHGRAQGRDPDPRQHALDPREREPTRSCSPIKARVGGAFLFLPLAHSFGRMVEFGGAFYTCKVILSSIATVAEDLGLTRPGFLPAAPRVFERVYGKIMTGVASAPPIRQKLFHWAIGVGKQTIPFRQKNKPLPFGLGLKFGLADKLVLGKIRAKLGMDRMHALMSGSAPLPREVAEFFAGVGLVILEAYGLTETCPGLTTNRFDDWRIGTVGPAIKGVQLQLASDGEILAKGPNVVSGYLNRPDATAEAWDEKGWFHTGDIGELDPDGHLRITDRKKDLIKTSGGKYVAPQKIEALLKTKADPVGGGGHRRQSQVLRGAGDGRQGEAGGVGPAHRQPAGHAGAGGAEGDPELPRRGQQGARELRVDQVLPRDRPGVLGRQRAADGVVQGQAQGGRRALQGPDRLDVHQGEGLGRLSSVGLVGPPTGVYLEGHARSGMSLCSCGVSPALSHSGPVTVPS
jgi:long-chain acyl-CoA synthetase